MDLRHLRIGRFDFGRKITRKHSCCNCKAALCLRRADEVLDRLVAFERLTCPILADLAEEPMLDWIPFGCSRRVMADSDLEPKAVAEASLELVLPSAVARTVAPTAVGENEQTLDVEVVSLPCARPPSRERGDCESRRIMGGTDEDVSTIGSSLVEPPGDSCAQGIFLEIVVMDEGRFSFPRGARVLETADHLLLLRVDADDRRSVPGVALPHAGDILELLVPIRVGVPCQLLVIHAQGKLKILEYACNRFGGGVDICLA